MANRSAIDLTGADQLKKVLSAFEVKVQKKLLRKAVAKASRPMVKEARKNARKIKESGLLAASMGVRIKRYPKSMSYVAVIGPRTGFKSKKRNSLSGQRALRNPSNYAHLVEFGTRPHEISSENRSMIIGGIYIKGAIKHPGSRPKPFLRPAFDKYKGTALKLIAQSISEEMKKLKR